MQAGEDLIPVVYRELRRRVAAYLRGERRDHTLQPTARVHEAYRRSGASADSKGFRCGLRACSRCRFVVLLETAMLYLRPEP